MKKRIISMLLVLAMTVGMVQVFGVPVIAATTLTITQPLNGAWISYSNAPRLEWNDVDGAAGYRISIRNLVTNELVVDNKWTTSTYYKLDGRLDAAAAEYRIWVGAMRSKSEASSSSFTSSTITVHTKPESPEIEDETWEETTYNSVVLSMEITRDNGNAITDSGFYIVESGLPTSEADKYSFKKYGSYSATSKGYKKMTITGLKPDTKYQFWAYAVNGVGETETSSHYFRTDEYECPHNFGVYTNTYPESISYVDIDDSKQHKEIWYYHQYCNYCDEVVKQKAVKETNYGDHQFVDDVCKLCKYEKTGGAKFDQKPTLSLSISGNNISGSIYGTYYPGDTIYFQCTANYSDHIFIETSSSELVFTNPSGYEGKSGTFIEKSSASTFTPKSYTNGSVFSLAIPVPAGILAGDYTISVTATDGVYDPNTNGSIAGTSYYESVKKSVTVRIGDKTSSGSDSENVTADDVIAYAEKYLGKKSGNNEFFNWIVDWCGYFVGWVGRNAGANFPTKDSQCANGRALTAWFVNNDAGTFYYFRSKNYDSLISQETISENGKRLCQLSTREEFIPQRGDIIVFLWSDSEAQGYNWSHVGFVKNYNSSSKTIYTIEGNTTSDPQVANRTRTYGSEVVAFIRPNYSTENIHTHSYSEHGFEAEHPHKAYNKCACGAYEYTGKTISMASCNNCFPDNRDYYTQSELEAAVRNGELTDYNIYLAWYHSVFNAEGRDAQLKDYCDTLLYNSFAELYEEEVVRTWLMKVWAKCGNLTEKEFYSSLLYTLLAGQTESGNNSYFEVYESEEVSAAKLIFSLASEVTGIQYDKLSDAFKAIKQAAGTSPAKISEAYKEVAKLAPYKKFFEGLGDTVGVFDYMVTLSQNEKDFQERVSHIMKITEASEKLKNILYEMSIDGSNHDYIQLAAYDLYCAMCEEDYSRRLEQVLKTEAQKQAGYAAKDALLIVVDDIIGSVVPGVALGMSAVDLLFDMSGEGESIAVMIMLGEMSDAIFRAAEKIRVKFVNTPSSDNARDYIVAMDLCHRFMLLTCEYTEEHLYDVFKSGIAKELIKNQDVYTTYMTNLLDSKAKIIEKYNVFYSTPQDLFDTCLAQLNTRYKITYSANGGTGTPSAQYNTVGNTTLTSAVPMYENHTFLGWAESSTATKATYKSGAVLPETKDGNITLFAVWQTGTQECEHDWVEGERIGDEIEYVCSKCDLVSKRPAYGGGTVVTQCSVNNVGDIAYTVNGNVVTVDHEVACKVGYLSGSKYISITATSNSNGTYSFSVPSGITEVILVVKGDANGDGTVSLADATKTRAASGKKTTLNEKQRFAADVNGDGDITLADSTKIRATSGKKTTISW